MAISENGLGLVDGRGVERAVRQIMINQVSLRLANESDCEPIYYWRNHEKTRRYFFDTSEIFLDEHRNWYRKALKNSKCILLVGSIGDDSIGVLRYDLDGSKAVVSIYLAPDKHGFGYGTAMLKEGEIWLRKHHPEISTIAAKVLVENYASRNAFSKAGFSENTLLFEKAISDKPCSITKSQPGIKN